MPRPASEPRGACRVFVMRWFPYGMRHAFCIMIEPADDAAIRALKDNLGAEHDVDRCGSSVLLTFYYDKHRGDGIKEQLARQALHRAGYRYDPAVFPSAEDAAACWDAQQLREAFCVRST